MKKRFITQVVFVLAAVFIISTAAFFLICKGLKQAKRDSLGKFNYILLDTTYYNTVFFGSSTTRVSVNCPLLDSLTGSHSFNAATDGAGIAELNMVVRKYLKSHGSPQRIFIGFDELTLAMTTGVWYFPQYYPYVHDADLKELVALEPKLLLGKYLPAVAVTYFDDPHKNLGLIGLLKNDAKAPYDIPLQGFEPKRNIKMSEEVPRVGAYYHSCAHAWQLLQETVAECERRNVSVSFILPPRYNYFMSDSSAPFVEKIKFFENKYGTRTYNYAADARFQSKDLYFDRIHLNEQGADLFTAALAKEALLR